MNSLLTIYDNDHKEQREIFQIETDKIAWIKLNKPKLPLGRYHLELRFADPDAGNPIGLDWLFRAEPRVTVEQEVIF